MCGGNACLVPLPGPPRPSLGCLESQLWPLRAKIKSHLQSGINLVHLGATRGQKSGRFGGNKGTACAKSKDRHGVGVALGLGGTWGAGRAAGAGRDLARRQVWGSAQRWHPGQCSSSHALPCPASDGLLISSFSPFMVFPVAVAFINKHFGDLPLRTSAPQESRALNIYK